MSQARRPSVLHLPRDLLTRVVAGPTGVPWRTRAFWVTQALVIGVVGVHLTDDRYGAGLAQIPAVVTLVLLVVPVGYAAVQFGLRGSLPTAVWAAVLMLPDMLVIDSGVQRWTDGSVVALVLILAVAAGRTVDLERRASASRVAEDRVRGIARVADQLLEGLCVTDLAGVITYVNSAWVTMQGLSSPASALGLPLASFHAQEEEDADEALPYQLPLDANLPRRGLVRHHPPGRAEYLASVTVVPLLDERGRAVGRLSTVRDVTAEQRAATALQEAEERFRVTFERAPLGMALITTEAGFLQVNDALCEMLGRSRDEVIALGADGLTHPEDREPMRALPRRDGRQERLVKRYQHADGHFLLMQISSSLVSDPAGRPLYYVSQFQDVTEEQRSQLQLIEQAFHDPLTGLPNRALFEERVGQALARVRRQRSLLAVMFCDLNDFKEVNDRFGHQAGDDTLRSVAARLQGCIRETDTVARFGGDEFVFLLDGLSGPSEVEVTVARIHEAMRPPHFLGDQQVVVSASIGVAIGSWRSSSLETLLGQADAAMYQAKAAGGGRAAVFGEPDWYQPGDTATRPGDS